ncbi:hypothetical protein QBC43DRAFT_301359 [Cladorrhinum sp. PSN259]|nr:hypothetical protein QBC43DRAFT_301359 [Cladorrhinum sp. PSN259]
MSANPITITVPAGSVGQIIALSNSSSTQRVTVSIDTTQAGVFQGSGMATAMSLTTGGSSVPITRSAGFQNCSILFEYSQSQSNWTPSAAITPTTTSVDNLTTIQIAANNSSSTKNDTVLMISLFSPEAKNEQAKLAATQDSDPKDDSLSATKPSSKVINSSMTIHAKTYYNNPAVHGGDEWNIILDFDNPRPISPYRRKIPGEGRSLGWRQIEVNCQWSEGIVLNTLELFVTAWDGVHDGMENGRLEIMASTWCVGYRPATWSSPNWNGSLNGCAFELVEVTP